jgi:hypothetical protein
MLVSIREQKAEREKRSITERTRGKRFNDQRAAGEK